jgi:hypothetical protein
MQAFENVDIKDFAAVEDCEIYGLTSKLPQTGENRAAKTAQCGLVSCSAAKTDELWPYHVCLALVAKEVSGAFKMRNKAVRGAFIERGDIGNVFEGQALGCTVKNLKDAKDFADHADGRRL